MGDAPELTDEVLDTLITLAMINERFRRFEESNPNHFHQQAMEVQNTYLRSIRPILRPYADFYPAIRDEMDVRTRIYANQLSKGWDKNNEEFKRYVAVLKKMEEEQEASFMKSKK